MRAGGVEDPLDRQIEGLVEGGDAGQAAGGIGQAVIAAEPRDHLLLLRPAAQIVVIADQLEIGVVGVRARGAEEHLRQMPGAGLLAEQGQHPVGEPDDRLVRVRSEGVIIAEIAHRLRRRFAELGAAIADIDAPQPGIAAADVDLVGKRQRDRHSRTRLIEISVPRHHALNPGLAPRRPHRDDIAWANQPVTICPA